MKTKQKNQVYQSIKPILMLQMMLLSPWVRAHDGHGIEASSHWHATDGWGWIVGLAVVALLWGARKP